MRKKTSGRGPRTEWYGNCYRQGFKNLGATPMVGEFDAEKLVKYWKDTGAELVFMNAFFQAYALYPSTLTIMDPNLKGRDLVAEFVAACRKHGVKPAAYVSPQNHWPYMDGHPDWCQTQTDGLLYKGMPYMYPKYYSDSCLNSPFTGKMEALLTECFSKYSFDAAFYDNAFTREGICHCRFCREQFKAEYGVELPNQDDIADPVYRQAMAFKYDSFRKGILRFVAVARAVSPDLAIVFNNVSGFCHWCCGTGEDLTEALDYSCTEHVEGAGVLDRLGYAHDTVAGRTAYHLGFLRGRSGRNRKVQAYNYVVEPGSNHRMDLDIRLEMLSAVAFGGVPAIQGERPVLKEIFGYLKDCEPYLADTQPVPYIGILASQRSCDTHNFQLGTSHTYYGDLKGTFNAMLDLHQPVEFLSGNTLEAGRIEDLAVIVLSDVGYLTPAQIDVLRCFVRKGGGLVATHQTSLIGEDSKALSNFALADVFGVEAAGEVRRDQRGLLLFDAQSGITRFLDMPKARNAGEGRWMKGNAFYHENGELLFDPVQPVVARKGTQIAAHYLPLAGGGETARKAESPACPALVVNRHGAGTCVYLAQRFGETYGRMPFPVWRQMMADALGAVAPRPAPLEIVAPPCVSVKLWEQPGSRGRWILHLVNDLDIVGRPAERGYEGLKTGKTGGRPREGVVPVDGIRVVVRKLGATCARLPLEKRDLQVAKEGTALTFMLDRLEQHALVVIE